MSIRFIDAISDGRIRRYLVYPGIRGAADRPIGGCPDVWRHGGWRRARLAVPAARPPTAGRNVPNVLLIGTPVTPVPLRYKPRRDRTVIINICPGRYQADRNVENDKRSYTIVRRYVSSWSMRFVLLTRLGSNNNNNKNKSKRFAGREQF